MAILTSMERIRTCWKYSKRILYEKYRQKEILGVIRAFLRLEEIYGTIPS